MADLATYMAVNGKATLSKPFQPQVPDNRRELYSQSESHDHRHKLCHVELPKVRSDLFSQAESDDHGRKGYHLMDPNMANMGGM